MHPVVLEYKKEVDRYTIKIQNGLLSYMFRPREVIIRLISKTNEGSIQIIVLEERSRYA